MADYGLYFDGEDDYVSIPHSTSLDLNDNFTVIVLIKANENTDYRIINKYSSDNIGWLIDLQDGKARVKVSDGTNTADSGGVGNLLAGDYHLIGFTLTKATDGLKIYVDGDQVAALDASAIGTITNTENVDIGVIESITGHYFKGIGAVYLIYNKVLTDTEIQSIYNDPTNPSTDGLVLWLAPDSVDTANDIWTDKSSNGNDGTIYGCLYIPTRWITKDGVLTIEEIWELNTVRFNYPFPARIRNKINRVVEVIPTLNNTYVVFDKALGGEEVTFTFYLDPDYDDDEKIRSEILSSGIIKIRTPDLRYYGDYVVKNIDWDIDAFNKYILKITAVRV